jgi:hypothetical protein
MRWLVIVTNYFSSRLCWKVSLETTKIVNHDRKSNTCNWYMLPCCVISLSEGRVVIEVCTSLANYILHFYGGHWCILVATYWVREYLRNQVVSTLILYVMSHWHGEVWIRISDISMVLLYYLCSYGESYLLITLCAGDKCDMEDSDEDHDKSRRPGAEDRGWSSTDRIFSGRAIGRSGDAVCDLHHTCGDEEREFLGWASKPRSSLLVEPQNHGRRFLGLDLKITASIS